MGGRSRSLNHPVGVGQLELHTLRGITTDSFQAHFVWGRKQQQQQKHCHIYFGGKTLVLQPIAYNWRIFCLGFHNDSRKRMCMYVPGPGPGPGMRVYVCIYICVPGPGVYVCMYAPGMHLVCTWCVFM